MKNISKLIVQKSGKAELLSELQKLPGSELNSLLLELFRTRSKKISPADLLKQFEKNRFAAPSSVDAVAFRKLEIECLELARERDFTLLTLSPLTSLGTCSSVAFVDQNNVVSALRGTEVVADATNVFALMMAKEFKQKRSETVIKYATAHRHVRSQALLNPAFTPHFGIFCLATGGLDRGNFSFELEHFLEHIQIHLTVFLKEFEKDKLLLKIYLKDENKNLQDKLRIAILDLDKLIKVKIENDEPGDYYKAARFKFFLERDGKEINLSDGGFVDWTQKLIQNKKHRLIISGVGTELIYKLKHNLLRH